MAGDSEETATQRICVGAIAGAQGVRGAVRIKTFTEEPRGISAYGGLTDERGHPIEISVKELRGDLVIAAVEGVNDRDAAQALKGTRLYVPRTALPETGTEEFYHADLLGLAVETVDGTPFGKVQAVHDFGAGDVLEIATDGRTVMVPFTREAVPDVDLGAQRLVVDPPPGLPGFEPEDGP